MRKTLNISLTERHAAFLEGEVGSGRAHNQAEVIRHGIELVMRERELHELRAQRLRTELARGYDDLRQGRSVEIEAGSLRRFFEEEDTPTESA